MWKYEKTLAYPVNIRNKDLRMAKILHDGLGGADGELGASIRYLQQRYTMPDNKGRALLTDIGTEELGHIEIISTMIYQLLKGSTIEELKENGLETYYSAHGRGVYPSNSDGIPFNAASLSVTGNFMSDLVEDMAAEKKAKAGYEHMMDLTDDKDILAPLTYLYQREIVHYQRFKELFDYYQSKGY